LLTVTRFRVQESTGYLNLCNKMYITKYVLLHIY